MKSAPRNSWLVLGLLTAAFVLNYMDRQIINILSQPIKAELHISDSALSFLAGTAFTVVYAAVAIPIARAADRFDRVNVVSLSVGFWSVMTALCGFAQGYAPLLLCRIGVGLGEAGGIPASHALLSDHFGPRRRALAMGVYAFGIPGGTLLGLLMGGVINDWVGWRWAFLIAAAPGLLLALVLRALVREVPRGSAEADPVEQTRPDFATTFAALLRNGPYWMITLGCGSALLFVYVSNAWFPALLIRLHHMPVHQAGVALGLFAGVGGGFATLLSGRATQALAARVANPELWLASGGLLLTFPVYLAAVAVQDTRIALVLMAVQFTLIYVWVGPSYAVTQRVVPVHMRALASSIQVGVGAIIAQLLGPQLVGLLSDLFARRYGGQGLRYALLCVAIASLVGAGLFTGSGLMLARRRPPGAPSSPELDAATAR